METNYFICPNCPDGNGKYKRTRHVEISNAAASAACGDTSTSRKILGTIGFIADKTKLGTIAKLATGCKNWKCTECGMISERTHDGTINVFKIQNNI